MHKRKTILERRQEREHAEARAWDDFRPKLEAIQSYRDALILVSNSPPVDSPGRAFYSNLGFFLQAFMPPQDATGTEKTIYITLIRRMDEKGELKPDEGQRIEKDLNKAISEQ